MGGDRVFVWVVAPVAQALVYLGKAALLDGMRRGSAARGAGRGDYPLCSMRFRMSRSVWFSNI